MCCHQFTIALPGSEKGQFFSRRKKWFQPMGAFRHQDGGSRRNFRTVLLQLFDFGGGPIRKRRTLRLGKVPPKHGINRFDTSCRRTNTMTVPKLSIFWGGPSVSRNSSNQSLQFALRNGLCFLHRLTQLRRLCSQKLKKRSFGKITLFFFFYEPMSGPFGNAQAVVGDFRSGSSRAGSIFRNMNPICQVFFQSREKFFCFVRRLRLIYFLHCFNCPEPFGTAYARTLNHHARQLIAKMKFNRTVWMGQKL